MSNNILVDSSLEFSVSIVNICDNIKGRATLTNQLLRSGTSIGANIREAEQAQSRADFLSKQNIALKEANETEYWLELLMQTGFITQNEYESINNDCVELNKLLISIIKSTKQPNENQ